jgi:quinoprotein glucose dehydrogenase
MRNAWVYSLVASLTLFAQTLAVEFSEKPIAVEAVRAFPELKFRRPIVLTHAGDGSNRVFVAEQRGQVFVFPNEADVEKPELFLDLEPKVTYKDTENEEGFLGMAFHPKFKENGEFFVYYTSREAPHLSVISRFRVSKDNPNQADAKSEEELLRIPQPFWNHNGGTIAFGPDGMLYIALGDGGKGGDPLKAGQDKSTILGKLLRIDVDHKDEGLNYAIPKDNPFVGEKGARGEIWAYGFRNPWRHAFDRETGLLWLADVGQDKWEEIDIVTKGGNYGWNIREGLHNFAGKSDETPQGMIDPIWEYNHILGKSITGGNVYRGKQVPQLVGKYLYGDYVGKQIWALDYDTQAKKVVANYRIAGGENPPLDIVSFGEDENGEAYLLESLGRIFTFKTKE